MREIEDEIITIQSNALWPAYWKGNEVRLLKDCYTDITPTRGDIIIADALTSWLFRFVLGLPHDILDLDDRYNPAVLKVNGLVLYNYTKKPYVVGKELFYSLFGGKNSIRIADGHCLILPNDPQLYKQKYPFGIIPIDNIIGRVVASDEGSLGSDATPIGLKSHLRGDKFDAFDASGRAGHYIND